MTCFDEKQLTYYVILEGLSGNGWDPAHPTAGNNWEKQALFDFQNRALPAMN